MLAGCDVFLVTAEMIIVNLAFDREVLPLPSPLLVQYVRTKQSLI